MKNGICPKCNSTNVYFKEYALNAVALDGKNVDYVDYVCTDACSQWRQRKSGL